MDKQIKYKYRHFVQISAKDCFRLHHTDTVDAAKQIGLAMRMYAADNNDAFPTILQQLVADTGKGRSYFGSKNFTTFIGDIWLDSFDLVNGSITNLMEHPRMIAIREHMPRQSPNGKWERVYGLADGSVQTATSPNGNFDQWENTNTEQPPSQLFNVPP